MIYLFSADSGKCRIIIRASTTMQAEEFLRKELEQKGRSDLFPQGRPVVFKVLQLDNGVIYSNLEKAT